MIDEDILNHGKTYLNTEQFDKAIKVFRNGKDFKKNSENDYRRRALLAFCLFQLEELEETIAIAKTVRPKDVLCKELASTLICSSLFRLERYEQAFLTMRIYLQDHTPKLYLRTLKIFLEDIADGIITDETIINEIKEWSEKYNVSLEE